MKATILLTVALSFLLGACTHTRNNSGQTAMPAFKQSPLDSAYASIRPQIQTFTFNNNSMNKVKAAHGTELLIPAGCFVTADGGKVENVQLEIVEAFSLPAFVTSGLVTLSNGALLVSNGMLYINARSGKEDLLLREGASLTVSMPTMTNGNGFQLFSGDGSNWAADSSMTAMDYAMPLPLDLLYPEGNDIFWYCIFSSADNKSKTYVYDTTMLDVTDKKYEQTAIATEAFESRINALRHMTLWMSYIVNRDFYFDKADCENERFNYDILKVYFDHPTRSFRESDSVAKSMYLNYFMANKEKLAAFFEEVNAYKRTSTYNWTDTNYYFDFRKESLEESFMEPLQNFPPANTKEIKLVDNHGVNPDAPDAVEQLSAKGVSAREINQLLDYHFRRQAKIRELQKAKEAIVTKKQLEQMYQTTVFSVSRMGWINCDRFYDDPSAGKAAIYVSNNSGHQLDFIDCSLVIPDLNVRLSAYPDSTGKWTFTKKGGPYTKLPLGRDAVITGISLQHDSVFFASQKITIQDSLFLALPMKHIPKNKLKDSLEAALKN